MEIPAWFRQDLISGLFLLALGAVLTRAYNLGTQMFRSWRERDRASDAQAAARMAQDIYRLVIMVGVVLLVVLSTLCGGLGLTLLVYRITTPGASWLYYLPIGLFFGAVLFCNRGISLLSQAADHLKASEERAEQARGPQLKA